MENKRIWEVDFLRGVAIIMVVLFHFFWDLYYFGFSSIDTQHGFLRYFGLVAATTFLLLAGVSLTLSYQRRRLKFTGMTLFKHYFLRGLTIFSWGLFITLFTWIFVGDGFVIFGILHLIGVSVILAIPFLNLKIWNVFFGILFFLSGNVVATLSFQSYWLVWLGIHPNTFYSIDYFPMLPWFGVIIFGIFLGNILYPKGERILYLPSVDTLAGTQWIMFLGRHSLLIYLLHQPILFGVFLLLMV